MQALIIEQTLRRERARIVAQLYRLARDLELVEEAVQEASLEATVQWARDGLPDNPGAWLHVVAKRRTIDLLRRRRDDDDLEAVNEAPAELGSTQDKADRLRLLLACCAAEVPERARMALALRAFLGLSTREIARAFLEPEATTAQRLVRARRALKRRPPDVLDEPLSAESLALVLRVIYLTFNEGYLAAEGDSLVRHHLMDDALTLGETVVELAPSDPEAWGLLALMCLHASRRDARVDGSGALLTLEEQDRSRWDQTAIARGRTSLERALSLHRGLATGPYQLQAAIGALHALAPTAAETDWVQIAALYRRLLDFEPSPVVELNAAIALAFSGDLTGGLRWLNGLERRGVLRRSHLLPSAKGLLLERAGAFSQARRSLGRARVLATNEREKQYLTRRIEALDQRRESR